MKKYIQQVKQQVQGKVDRYKGVKKRGNTNEYELKKQKEKAEKEKKLLAKLFETAKEDPKKMEKKKKAIGSGFSVAPPKKKKKKKKKKGAGKTAPPPPPIDNRPIEVIIEEKRSKLYSSGKKLTPVTPETFAAWKKKYLANKAKLEKKNKKSNKPSGRDAFSKSKFQDDDGAAEATLLEAKSLLEAEVEEEEKREGEGDGAVDASLFEGDDLDVDDLGDLDELDLGDEA